MSRVDMTVTKGTATAIENEEVERDDPLQESGISTKSPPLPYQLGMLKNPTRLQKHHPKGDSKTHSGPNTQKIKEEKEPPRRPEVDLSDSTIRTEVYQLGFFGIWCIQPANGCGTGADTKVHSGNANFVHFLYCHQLGPNICKHKDNDQARNRVLKQTGSRLFCSSHAQDVKSTSDKLHQELKNLTARRDTSSLCITVCTDAEHNNVPEYYIDTISRDFIEIYLAMSVHDFYTKYESYMLLGLSGVTVNNNNRRTLLKKTIRSMVCSALCQLTDIAKARMSWLNYKICVVQKYSVVLEGWPTSTMELGGMSLAVLQSIIDGIHNGRGSVGTLTGSDHPRAGDPFPTDQRESGSGFLQILQTHGYPWVLRTCRKDMRAIRMFAALDLQGHPSPLRDRDHDLHTRDTAAQRLRRPTSPSNNLSATPSSAARALPTPADDDAAEAAAVAEQQKIQRSQSARMDILPLPSSGQRALQAAANQEFLYEANPDESLFASPMLPPVTHASRCHPASVPRLRHTTMICLVHRSLWHQLWKSLPAYSQSSTLRFPPLFTNDFGPATLLFPQPSLANPLPYGEDTSSRAIANERYRMEGHGVHQDSAAYSCSLAPTYAFNQYAQGPQGDPFAPQPPPQFFPDPNLHTPTDELAQTVSKPVKRKRRLQREEECGFCGGSDSRSCGPPSSSRSTRSSRKSPAATTPTAGALATAASALALAPAPSSIASYSSYASETSSATLSSHSSFDTGAAYAYRRSPLAVIAYTHATRTRLTQTRRSVRPAGPGQAGVRVRVLKFSYPRKRIRIYPRSDPCYALSWKKLTAEELQARITTLKASRNQPTIMCKKRSDAGVKCKAVASDSDSEMVEENDSD
ncbi:hypothetical protein DFH11DRAFT_1550220 [Phellopilus nigrolimitatus]|nr:hypothetical protein DFH11DRAFT_1550220 [Phellopilus nigrolimitatus]